MGERYNKEFIEAVKAMPVEAEYCRIFGQSLPTGKFFCPFHHNVNTPSAKVYSNRIKCFSCNRTYSTFDLLIKYDPDRIKEIARTAQPNLQPKAPTLPRTVKYILRRDLDLSKGITIGLLDSIADYGQN